MPNSARIQVQHAVVANDHRLDSRRRPWARLATGGILVIALMAVCGCHALTGGRTYPVEGLHLLTLPVAVNIDQVAGADGVALKVYASNPDAPKAISIQSGKLALLMFDGPLSMQKRSQAKPLRVWEYPARELRAYAYESPLGIVYQFVLPWEDARPKNSVVTMVAEYTAPDGRKLVSAPAVVTTGVQ